MAEPHTAIAGRSRERWIVAAIAGLLVIARSAVFIWQPESYFDSDQAIVGLMAKHLSELRAFPVFFYGQQYMLGVEAWLAAPLFAVFGASASALKVPLLAMNVAVALLLTSAFTRDLGLTPFKALVATLPFIIPSVGLSALLMDSNGGNIEPFVYVVLLWTLRGQPWLCGLVSGIGFLNREFTVYGLLALAALEAADRTLFSRAGAARWARMLGVAAIAWLLVQGVNQLASASGPGTSVHDTLTASNNLAELAARSCISPATAVAGVGRLFTIHWPALLGTASYPLTAFSIESRVSQGLTGASWLPAVLILLSIAGIVAVRTPGTAAHRPRFAQFLILTGAFSVAGYLFGRCGEVNFYAARYELLSVLVIAGVTGWLLSVRPPAALRAAWAIAFAGWMTVIVVPHVRFWVEYATHPPVPAKHQLIRALEARGIRFARADYWIAYYIDFITNERIIVASDDPRRVLLYDRIVADHQTETVRLSRRPCEGGDLLIPGVYRCP